ncbi:AAA family ATPase [Brachyspira innocens]|uniref:AAA family ATPase n=1 Tax=Brachyspira innocens TaxID=13264 RepID=UPI00035CCEC3|nr:AAA family ATPase [Brachyspira innocens]
MKNELKEKLIEYIEALRPIIYINHFDFEKIDKIIFDVSSGYKVYEWVNNDITYEWTKDEENERIIRCFKAGTDLKSFLKMQHNSTKEHFIVLKNINEYLDDTEIVSWILDMAYKRMNDEDYHVTIFIVSTVFYIPSEIEKYTTIFDIPFPTRDDISNLLDSYVDSYDLDIENIKNELIASLRGLSEFEITQILNLAIQRKGFISLDDQDLILGEKEQTIKKSGIVEIVNYKGGLDNIGGLDDLKDYIRVKAKIFENLGKAMKFGVDIPKGILLVGLPGCGKSLASKSIANIFKTPLLRLDIGKLMGKYVGESEENLRKAIKIAEAVTPCVLWIDEIEKAFAGIGGTGGASDITTRLLGYILTWLQEKDSTVYVVATSNDITKLPAEFFRKGRFDELFRIELPNAKERKEIFELHLKKRNQDISKLDIISLLDKTEGYSGADIESIIQHAIEKCFIEDCKKMETKDLEDAMKDFKCISVTFKEKLEEMKKNLDKYDMKYASKK